MSLRCWWQRGSESTGDRKRTSSLTTHSRQECVVRVRCHKVIRVQRMCLGQPWMCRLQRSVKKCHAEKWGLPVDGKYMGLLLFADSCWLIATSPAELRCMARAWNELLVCAGLRIVLKEPVWCTSASDSLAAKIEVEGTVSTRMPREQGFKALGVSITFDGHFVKELAERGVIAWRSFYAMRKLWDNKVALRHRLRLLSSCFTSSLCWCSGSWILNQSQRTHLRAIQDKMLRRMILFASKPIRTISVGFGIN